MKLSAYICAAKAETNADNARSLLLRHFSRHTALHIKEENEKSMKRNILLLLALFLLALPMSAKRKKVTDEERAQAIAVMVDMLKNDRWTMFIDNINSSHIGFSQLIPERNYIYIEDKHLVLQTDKTMSFVSRNFTPMSFYGSGRVRGELLMAMRPVDRHVFDVIVTEISLNRKGTKVYLSIICADSRGHRSRQRMTIDPVTLRANIGVYSGRIEPVDEVILRVPAK